MLTKPIAAARPFKPWNCSLVAEYDPANLDRFETRRRADKWRHHRIARLLDGDARCTAVAERMADCSESDPCFSGACPTSLRLVRRWFVSAASALIKERGWSSGQGYAVTLVPPYSRVEMGQLNPRQIVNLASAVRYRLMRSSISQHLVLGGWDFSLNVRTTGDTYWQPHLYLVLPSLNAKKALRKELKDWLASDPDNLKPLYFKSLEHLGSPLTYALKSYFETRSSYIGKNGRENTRPFPMKADRERELMVFLDELGITRRLFLLNGHRRGCRIEGDEQPKVSNVIGFTKRDIAPKRTV